MTTCLASAFIETPPAASLRWFWKRFSLRFTRSHKHTLKFFSKCLACANFNCTTFKSIAKYLRFKFLHKFCKYNSCKYLNFTIDPLCSHSSLLALQEEVASAKCDVKAFYLASLRLPSETVLLITRCRRVLLCEKCVARIMRFWRLAMLVATS